MLEEGLASSLTDAMDQPLLLASEVMEGRAFVRAYAKVTNGRVEQKDLDQDPMLQLVWDMQEVDTVGAIEARRARLQERNDGNPG